MNQPNHNPYVRRWDKETQETYYEHRAVAEQKLGRPLKAGEVVHHCNHDTQDNHPDNLYIFSNHRAHMLFENYEAREKKGITHLFTVEEHLEAMGLWVVR